jgi:RNA polymerase sigma-70 factor (ECF subfamily)
VTATDEELTALVIAFGDKQAFGALVRRHQGVVRNMLARMTGDRATADDIAQDAFLRAFERIRSYSGEGSFRSWLCGVAYNELLHAARKTRSARRTLDAYADRERVAAPGSAAGPTGDAIDINRALARLPDAERTAVVLCYACGFSHPEAAELMKLPLGTLKTYVLRGRQKLEDLLSSHRKDVP